MLNSKNRKPESGGITQVSQPPTDTIVEAQLAKHTLPEKQFENPYESPGPINHIHKSDKGFAIKTARNGARTTNSVANNLLAIDAAAIVIASGDLLISHHTITTP